MKDFKILQMIVILLLLLSCKESNNEPINPDIKEALEYYPLEVGNLWVYDATYSGIFIEGSYAYYVKKEVLKDSVIDGNKYFLIRFLPVIDSTFKNKISPFSTNYELRTVDKNDGTLYRRPTIVWNEDLYVVNLAMKEGETIISGKDATREEVMCLQESNFDFSGQKTFVKKFEKNDIYQSYKYDFAKGIGLVMYQLFAETKEYNMILKGAKIGKEVFGDTSIVK